MTTTEIFYLVLGGIAFWVVTLILRKRKRKEAKQEIKKPTPDAAVEIIREHRPEIFEEIDVQKVLEAATKPVAGGPDVGPFNASDLTQFLAAFGSENETWDLDQSGGVVNTGDLLVLLANFGVQQQAPYDIIPAWNNFYNHLPSSNQSAGWKLAPLVQDDGVSWNDIKADCDVKWFFEATLASENKDKCVIYEAVVNAGLCSGQFPLTCEITHKPSGKVFSRTGVTHINLTEGEGWYDVNPDLELCSVNYDYNISDVINLWSGPFDDYQFLTN
ncbi:MAG: hypothetical protein P8J32_07110, partial [bacterium]|nr:hypothetical protein [bacterium]